MSAVIVLSSSPPPAPFGRSPTVLESSPVRPRLSLIPDKLQSPRRFKPANSHRDGFPRPVDSAAVAEQSQARVAASQPTATLKSPRSSKMLLGAKISSASEERKRSLSPQVPCGRPALQRRTDWTPIKDDAVDGVFDLDDAPESAKAFPTGLLAKFEHVRDAKDAPDAVRPLALKRRKVDLVDVPGTESRTKASAKGRSKAAGRKAQTITHLATCHYLGKDIANEEAPVMPRHTSTQLREAGITDIDDLEVLLKTPPQRTKSKSCKKKEAANKAKILSPASALRILDNQETIFGSASQLAQDQSFCGASENVLADPCSPEAATQPISIGSTTPGTRGGGGTSRYVRRRNLWAAAGRDENNALLHVDTEDPFDLPCIRDAFAGKDVLLSPHQSAERIRQRPPPASTKVPVQSTGLLTARTKHTTALDHPTSDSHSSIRHVHTAAGKAEIENTTSATEPTEADSRTVDTGTGQLAAPPQKPSYAGLDTSVLQKRLKAYGFKPVKKREKAIELLDMCWEAERAKAKAGCESRADDPKHGDLLSRVHDVSSRAEPKTKTKKAATTTTERSKPKQAATDSSAKQPRSRKKAATETAAAPAKSKAKKTALAAQMAVIPSSEALEEPGLDMRPGQSREVIEAAAVDDRAPASDMSLAPQIQAAILQQSRNDSRTNRNHVSEPTWHEKILMYDPIVIEDLTLWLNTDGLDSIGEDREVSTVEVRAWLESRGICCLWKGGWRGQKSQAGDA